MESFDNQGDIAMNAVVKEIVGGKLVCWAGMELCRLIEQSPPAVLQLWGGSKDFLV